MSKPFHVFNLRSFLKGTAIVLFPPLVGFISSMVTRNSMTVYNVLIKPPLAPPSSVFPIVWGILFFLMGIALLLVVRKGFEKPYVKDAVKFFIIYLALNFLWPILFFNFKSFLFAFFVLLIMWIFLGIAAAKFYRISHPAGWLLLPTWLWTIFAGYLNLAVWILNR